MDRHQSTIRRKIQISGTGLHSGLTVAVEILPAPAGTGIVFERSDLPHAKPILATAHNLVSSELCTSISNGEATVSTIEHLMAAFVGLGIDNAVVRIDAAEVPILDGSAAPFVDQILAAGICKVDGFRRLFVVREAFEIRDGARLMRIEPDEKLRFDCNIDFASSKAIGRQSLDFTFSRSAFLSLCDSRTFCHIREVDAMRAAGLALGGSLANAVVVNDDAVVNPEGLRNPHEFVRHKLLDCIGDLALLGAPLVGKVTLVRTGHAMHARFMQELLRRKDELLSVVEIGPFRDKRPALPEGVAAMAAAAAIYG